MPNDRERSAELNRQAEIAFENGDFRQAGKLLEFAYQAYPEPTILYNLGQTLERAGEPDAALHAYRRYLEAAPTASDRSAVLALIEKLESTARPLHPTHTTDSTPTESGPPIARLPARDQPRRPGSTTRIAGLATAGVGAAMVGVGAYFAIQAGRRASEVDECAAAVPLCSKPHVDSLYRDGERAATTAKVLFGVGGAALIGGAILYYLGHQPEASDSALSVSSTAGSAGAVLEWRGAF
jgi:tetratricopeptide (TPR) repeat protein